MMVYGINYVSGENLHGRGGRPHLRARLPQRGGEPHPGGREDLLQGDAGERLEDGGGQFSGNLSEVRSTL